MLALQTTYHQWAMRHPTPPTDDLACLEAFILDNDDLVSLEEQIGRFNIFDALRIVRAEIRHSNFLAWLLDPAETLGNGPVFLRAVLMDMLRNTPYDLRPLSPVELDGLDRGRVEVRRESENIDLLITCEAANLIVAVENKVDSGEHSNQLQRYREAVERRAGGKRPLYVFLTRDRSEPSDDAWTPYGYADLHAALSRVRRLHHDS
ncbi:MAG: PD-(D/E)XK nuclease family protein, partial [Planctomycetota bacterium]